MRSFVGYVFGGISFIALMMCAGCVEAFNIVGAVAMILVFGISAKVGEVMFKEGE